MLAELKVILTTPVQLLMAHSVSIDAQLVRHQFQKLNRDGSSLGFSINPSNLLVSIITMSPEDQRISKDAHRFLVHAVASRIHRVPMKSRTWS